jgi:CubicO group peptidase (beta-lactamase class C family)
VAAAAAVEDGIFALDDAVCDSLNWWKNDSQKSRITYRQLLSLTSGLKASEQGFMRVQPSWRDQADGPMTGKPGEQFQYGANQLNTFALALQQSLGSETFEAYLKRRVLDPIGIKIAWRGRCADGNPQVAGGGFITSRDWATFGQFVCSEGSFNGKQVIAAEHLAECFKGTDANPAYGLTWWLKQPVSPQLVRSNTILRSEWADVANANELPGDAFAACGAGKQRLYVIPSRKLVVVRQSGFGGREFSDLTLLRHLLDAESAEN